MSKFEIYVIAKSSLQFYSARALKKLLSEGVEVTSTLPNSDTQKDLLMQMLSFSYAYFDTVLLNKQNLIKSKHDV